MAKPRFYIEPSDWDEKALALSGDEAHHCRDVMRCGEGERVVVFNGRGSEADVEIGSIRNDQIDLRTLTVTQTDRPPAFLTLGQAIPKGKNMDLIIQKATELGAGRIVPVLSQRTVVRLDEEESARKQEKWQRIAIEACKQCGQNWTPEVTPAVSVDEFLRQIGTDSGLCLVAALSADSLSLRSILSEFEEEQQPAGATILIGPEGDFTPAELSAISNAGFRFLSLGPIVLRSETAAIYALSVLGHELM